MTTATQTAANGMKTLREKRLKRAIRDRMAARAKARPSIETREQWLEEAVEAFRPWFAQVEAEVRSALADKGMGAEEIAERINCVLPQALKVTCGWPSQRGTAARGRVIGECWSPKVSADKTTTQIFVSPWMGHESATRVLDVLLHECVHAACGIPAGHGPFFKAVAVALGLEGKMTATVAGARLEARLDNLMISRLGHYPHKKMDVSEYERPVDRPKKQGTRMAKCECPECGYIARTTKKWLEKAGAPICPACMIQMEAN